MKGNVENRYVIQGRAIVQEIARIRSELNCMHKYYSTLHETCFRKVEVLWHNSNIYICTGECDGNIIFLHEIDWKIQMNNRCMSLMLLATLKIVSCLKDYYDHHHDNTIIVKLLCLLTSL